ncbi:helix-hairpin-helix domain-containing protein [Asaia krungthepensis]|uniref:helix-hairpin-helix domain-containing protein n=1 Tax=Asaia krungthepensis TaxID=220990 RepID=UPI00223027B1|nr:helix-hairpin-helix domain-containing protein [Asaia krungthepensis]
MSSNTPFTPQFSVNERLLLLRGKHIGPTVILRLEQIGIVSLSALSHHESEDICLRIAAHLGSRCWRNSPRARDAIATAITIARKESSPPQILSSHQP